MTREDIEKAAEDYAYKEWAGGGFECASQDSFIAGAEWRINSVWHDVSEIPTLENRYVLAIGGYDIVIPIRLCENIQESWAERIEYMHIKKWAYVKDLLPIKEEKK